MDNSIAVYGASMVAGAGFFLAALKHRGSSRYDSRRGISVADGNGLASEIIKKHPKYAIISPGVDHLLAGVGFTAGLAGLLGIIQNVGHSGNNFMSPFYFAATANVAKEAVAEFQSQLRRGGKIGWGDILQYVADVVSSGLVVGVASKLPKIP